MASGLYQVIVVVILATVVLSNHHHSTTTTSEMTTPHNHHSNNTVMTSDGTGDQEMKGNPHHDQTNDPRLHGNQTISESQHRKDTSEEDPGRDETSHQSQSSDSDSGLQHPNSSQMGEGHHQSHIPPYHNQSHTSPKERNDTMQTDSIENCTGPRIFLQEGLLCFQCQGTYDECGRKQHADNDPVRVCDRGHSCSVGRTGTADAADEFSMHTSQQKLGDDGDGPDPYVYYRDCFDETCDLEKEELHCMRVDTNVTCQKCCARNHCNADAFNSGTGFSTFTFSHSCVGVLVGVFCMLG